MAAQVMGYVTLSYTVHQTFKWKCHKSQPCIMRELEDNHTWQAPVVTCGHTASDQREE